MFMNLNFIRLCLTLSLAVMLALVGCGGGGGDSGSVAPPPSTFTVGGTVSGLSGTGLVLQNNNGGDLAIAANGTFTFATPLVAGAPYSVTVKTQPSGPAQTCTVGNGSGNTVSVVTNVTVICSTITYTVGGTVTGLSGTGLVLQNNGSDATNISANGPFTFATPVAAGATYNVTVRMQPGLAQVCTVGNGSGTATSAVTNVTVTCSAITYTVGGTVSGLNSTGLVLQNNGADATPISSNGTFTFATPVVYGATYNVTVSTQPSLPTRFCKVLNGSGTIGLINVTNVVVSCISQFAYVANSNSDDVSAFSIDPTTGALTNLGATVPAGTTPRAITLDPTGKFAYVANSASNDVSAYTMNARTGALTSVGAAVGAGVSPNSIAVDPTGKFVYVANGSSNNVSAYTINATTGVLTNVGAATLAGTNPSSVTVDPAGKFAYVTNYTSNDISIYAVNASTGALTNVGAAVPTGKSPQSIAIDPTGKFAYVAGNTDASNSYVAAFGINPTTGILTSLGPTLAAAMTSSSVAVDPTGKYVYVGNGIPDSVSAYAINASTGVLTSVGANVPSGVGGGRSIAFDLAGKFAFVAGSNYVATFTINATTGAITSAGSPALAGTGLLSIVTTR